jgi:uncharacterized caspase-like protein
MTLRVVLFLLAVLLAVRPAAAQDAETRIALVIGNAAYEAGALATPADDAGLIAQTLEAAGFDVVGARDLDRDTLRRALQDFVDAAQASGPDTVAVVYLSGYGLQLEGENYFVPIDARIARDSAVPAEAVRLSDYTRPLAALNLKASIIVLDAARANPFAPSGAPLAGGLALVDPEPGTLIAFNAAPGTVAPNRQGPYGAYAQALAEMMREGDLPLSDLFDRVRLRVNEVTDGAQVPWHASKVLAPFVFFERTADAAPPALSVERQREARDRPIGQLNPDAAYAAALDRDTLQGYLDFLAAFPDHPMAPRIRAIVAARREAIIWHLTYLDDTPAAYWSYLRLYPGGPHAADARRRLAALAAASEPPPDLSATPYQVPPPPPDEATYIDRPVLAFDNPSFAFGRPPPTPDFFLPPPPTDFVLLPPPPVAVVLFVLPIPVYRPVPIGVRPPRHIVPPPPNNVIYRNVHSTVAINSATNVVRITTAKGETRIVSPSPPPTAAGTPAGTHDPVTGIGPALPPSVARKALAIQQQQPGPPQPGAPGLPRVAPGAPGQRLEPMLEQEPARQVEPDRGRLLEQQRQQQLEQQRIQQIQQLDQARQQQIQQQRRQLEQQRLQQVQQQRQQELERLRQRPIQQRQRPQQIPQQIPQRQLWHRPPAEHSANRARSY